MPDSITDAPLETLRYLGDFWNILRERSSSSRTTRQTGHWAVTHAQFSGPEISLTDFLAYSHSVDPQHERLLVDDLETGGFKQLMNF